MIMYHHFLCEEACTHMKECVQKFNEELPPHIADIRRHAFFFTREKKEIASNVEPIKYDLNTLLAGGWTVFEANIEKIWPQYNPEEYVKSFRKITKSSEILAYKKIYQEDYDSCKTGLSYEPYLPEYMAMSPHFSSEDEKWDFIWSWHDDVDHLCDDELYLERLRGAEILKKLERR